MRPHRMPAMHRSGVTGGRGGAGAASAAAGLLSGPSGAARLRWMPPRLQRAPAARPPLTERPEAVGAGRQVGLVLQVLHAGLQRGAAGCAWRSVRGWVPGPRRCAAVPLGCASRSVAVPPAAAAALALAAPHHRPLLEDNIALLDVTRREQPFAAAAAGVEPHRHRRRRRPGARDDLRAGGRRGRARARAEAFLLRPSSPCAARRRRPAPDRDRPRTPPPVGRPAAGGAVRLPSWKIQRALWNALGGGPG
jgi:hypothetical protein